MPVPATQRVREAFDEQNSFLRAILGLASWLASFEKVLGSHGGTQPPSPPTKCSATEERVLDALLGAVYLKGRLQALCNELQSEGASRESVAVPRVHAPKRLASLLR